jgi:hypothetical protein
MHGDCLDPCPFRSDVAKRVRELRLRIDNYDSFVISKLRAQVNPQSNALEVEFEAVVEDQGRAVAVPGR